MSLFLPQVFEKVGLFLIILSKNDTRITLQTWYYKVVWFYCLLKDESEMTEAKFLMSHHVNIILIRF